MKNSKLFVALLVAALLVVSVALVACNSGYTLTFNTNGGTAIESMSFKAGQKVTPPATTRANFTFDGWYEDSNLTTPFTHFDSMPGQDVTVYAKWKAGESARIVFQSNGGSAVETYVGIVGQPTVQPANPTKTGYTFVNWYTDPDFNNVYIFGSPLTSGTTTLYAKWGTDSNYNYVTFHLNGEVTEVAVPKNTKMDEPPKADDVECIWYKDADYTTVYDFNVAVSDSFPLYGLMYSKGLTFSGNKVTDYSGTSDYVYVPVKYQGTVITTIGDGAFAYNTDVKYVTLADTVTTIENAAFYHCEYLVDINVTEAIANIGEFAFANCVRMVAEIDLSGVTAVADSAFANCNWLTTVIFGDGLTAIGNNAFINCASLTNVALTDSIETIGDYAFAYSGITSLNVPTSLTHFGTGVVKGASKLSSIDGGNDTFKVDSAAGTLVNEQTLLLYVTTTGNADETEFALTADVTDIAPYAFYGNATITNLDVSGATTLHLSSLEGLKALTSVKAYDLDSQHPYLAYWFGATDAKKNTSSGLYVPTTLAEVEFTHYSSTSVADYAFYGCNNIASIKGIGEIATIGEYAYGYTAIEEYEVAASVTSIATTAFYGAKKLRSITVEDGNDNYDSHDGALYSDTTLVYVPEGKTSISIDTEKATAIGEGAMYRSNVTELTVPDNITTIGKGAFENMIHLTSLTVPFIGGGTSETAYMLYVFGAEMSKNEPSGSEYGPPDFPVTDANKCPVSLRKITVTGDIDAIPQYAFAFCLSVTEIDCGDSYTSIGYGAFSQAGLVDVIIPDSVTTIADYAFFACTDMVNLTIGSGVTSIGKWAFGYLISVETIEFKQGANDLTIGESAFEAYSYLEDDYSIYAMSDLATLILSDNIVSIGDAAFRYVGYYGFTIDAYGYVIEDDYSRYTYLTVEFGANSRLKTIGEQAFFFAGITRVVLPSTVTSIGDAAFAVNFMLTEVVVGTAQATSQLTSIGAQAFVYCENLTRFVLYKTPADTVPTITSSVFGGTAVTVYVPSQSVAMYTNAWGNGYNIVSIQAI